MIPRGAFIERAKRDNARSPSKVSNHVGVVIHRDSSGTVMTIVRANRGKAILRTVREILVLDTYVHLSFLSLER